MTRLIVLFVLAALAAGADPVPGPSTMTSMMTEASAKKANFLSADAIDARALLPPPPAADSLVTRAELDVVLQFQAARTPEQVTRCQQIEGEDIFLFGSEVLGPWFNATQLPQTAAFFAQVKDDFLPINRAAKGVYPRRRPPFADARVKPCVEFSDSGAYPSGHGIQSSMWAGLLSAIFPEHAAGFAQRAEETRRVKLISGVHYPTDLVAGQLLGEAVARELLKSAAVQKAVTEIRAEAASFLSRNPG